MLSPWLGAADEIWSTAPARVHHATRRRGGGLATGGEGAAARDAGGRISLLGGPRTEHWGRRSSPQWPGRSRLRRGPQRIDGISVRVQRQFQARGTGG